MLSGQIESVLVDQVKAVNIQDDHLVKQKQSFEIIQYEETNIIEFEAQ
jgi:hypothetical protein